MSLLRTTLALSLLLAIPGCAETSEDEIASASGAQSPAGWFSIEAERTGNPWDRCEPQGGAASVGGIGGGGSEPESPEGAKVRDCLGKQGISFGTIAFLEEPPSEGGCLSLSCGPKKTLVVNVTKGADKMTGLGFAPLAKKTFGKAACDAPFTITSGFDQMMGASDVHEFLAGKKIAASKAGIGFAPGGTCGYRAVVFGADARAEAALEKEGFRDITK
jgi:hypothetical protein